MRALSILIPLSVVFLASGCSGDAQERTPAERAEMPEVVEGTLKHTTVRFPHAEFDGDLSIFEGEGWGFNPSLLIFLFLEEDEEIEGREFHVRAESGFKMGRPHVHYRWRDPGTGEIDVAAVMDNYEMDLVFGEITNGTLMGTIAFSVPGEGSRVRGHFRAKIAED